MYNAGNFFEGLLGNEKGIDTNGERGEDVRENDGARRDRPDDIRKRIHHIAGTVGMREDDNVANHGGL